MYNYKYNKYKTKYLKLLGGSIAKELKRYGIPNTSEYDRIPNTVERNSIPDTNKQFNISTIEGTTYNRQFDLFNFNLLNFRHQIRQLLKISTINIFDIVYDTTIITYKYK